MQNNPARAALSRAVNRAIANGAPIYVNQPAKPSIPRVVRLADLSDIPTPAHDEYTPAEMQAARAAMLETGLRYDNATGVISNRNGWLSRPSNPSDHEPMETLEEVMRWQFRAYIANAASRKRRGYSFA